MDTELLDYICGNRNAVRGDFIISRDKNNKNHCEMVYVQHVNMDKPLKKFTVVLLLFFSFLPQDNKINKRKIIKKLFILNSL